MSHKNVTVERHTFTKSEREYVKALVHGLSLKRITDQEIVQWLHDEKEIDIDRSTVSKMRNQIEQNAEKWYIELRQSRYKYIATYKERLDSLLSYQKKLHDIISDTKKDEVKIRAISELHSIEMDLFNLWKQLPELDIVDQERESNSNPNSNCQDGYDTEPWTWTIDDKPNPKPEPIEEKPIIAVAPIVSAAPDITKQEGNDRDGDGDEWNLLKCPNCSKSFYNNFTLSAHQCNPT